MDVKICQKCLNRQIMGEGNFLALLSYCLTNLSTTALMKLQGNVIVIEADNTHSFYHPFMQTWIMILGEALCIIPFWLRKEEAVKTDKPRAKIWVCLPPLILDLISSCLIFAGVYYVSGSVYSLMSSLVVVFTVLFSRCMLSFKPNRTQLLGCLLTIIGAALAGVGQSLQDKSEEDSDLILLGIGLLTLSFAIQGLQMTIIEQIYAKYELNPLQMVGWQGLTGTLIWSVLMLILANVGCPFPEAQCVSDETGNLHLEDYSTFFSSLFSNWYLFALFVSFMLLVARFNYDLSTVIVKTSAVTVCILRIFSDSMVWIIGLIVTVISGEDPQFTMESLDLTVNAFKLAAFVVSTLALLIYNSVVTFTCLKSQPVHNTDYSQLSPET